MDEIDPAAPRLSEELLILARSYPRETWAGHERLGQLAAFWLERHEMFRKLDRIIREGADAAVAERMDAAGFGPWFARHLQVYLGELEGHHSIEDHHYFPVFRRLEPRLVPGFELLENDHEAMDADIARMVEQANAILRHDPADPVGFRDAVARFADGFRVHGRGLVRHLDDEEDLVIPLILDRGEEAIGG